MTDTTDHDTVVDLLQTERDIHQNCYSMEHGKGRHIFFTKLILSKANNYFNFDNEGPRFRTCVLGQGHLSSH